MPIKLLFKKKVWPILFLISLIGALYYKLFLLGKIPFPGDALVGSYSPWFDYFKIPVHNPLITDVFSQFFLWKYLSIEQLQNMQWPLWNPYSFLGTPLLATFHSATLYPLNVLLLLPKYFGWGIFIFSQTLICALAFYLFISQIIKSNLAGITGSLVFCLGGLMTTWLEFGTAVHAISWLPLALFSIIRISHTLKIRYFLILVFSLVMIILAGNLQIVTYSLGLIILYSIWIFLTRKATLPRLGIILTAIVFGLILTSIQLLPSYDLLKKSIRQTENYTKEQNYGLLQTKDFFRFFIADYFGNTVTRNYWGTLNYSETSPFLGVIFLPIIIYTFFKIRTAETYFFLSIFGLSLLLIFDNNLSHAIYEAKIPLLTSSYASRLLFITILCASVIYAIALDHIKTNRGHDFFLKTVFWSWSAIIGIILGTFISYYLAKQSIQDVNTIQLLKRYIPSNELNLEYYIVAIKNSFIPIIILSLLLSSYYIIKRILKNISHTAGLIVFLVLIFSFIDLGRYFLKFNPFVEKSLIFPNVPALEFLQAKPGYFRVGREHAEILPPNTWMYYKLFSFEGYDPLYLADYAKFMNFLNTGNLENNSLTRYAELSSKYQSLFLDAIGAKYFVTVLRNKEGQIPGDELYYKFKDTDYNIVYKKGSIAILENSHAMQRAFFAKKIHFLSYPDTVKKFTEDKNFNPTTDIILSEATDLKNPDSDGNLKISKYSPNTVEIITDTSKNALLVLADQYEEGWHVKIDDNLNRIMKANLILRAVEIPSGKHTVTFYYWPDSFDSGLKITIAGAVFLFLITCIAKIKKAL